MATCLECSAELPSHRPGCDMPAVEAVRAAVLTGANPRTLQQVYDRALQPQPAPTGNGPEVLPVVLEFLARRQEQGRKKYGTVLRAHNGRDALRGLVEESADKLMYSVQLQMQWPALVARVRHDALEEALQVAESYLHTEPAPGAAKDELDRLAAYSNSTVRRIQERLRGLMGLPPPEPVRTGPRKGKPRKQPKRHVWALASREGEAKRWDCLACPLVKHEERSPHDGKVYVFRVDGVEIARGSPPRVGVPPCPPPPKGAP